MGDSHLGRLGGEGWWETVTWDGSAEEGWRETVTWDGSAEEGWWETVTWDGSVDARQSLRMACLRRNISAYEETATRDSLAEEGELLQLKRNGGTERLG